MKPKKPTFWVGWLVSQKRSFLRHYLWGHGFAMLMKTRKQKATIANKAMRNIAPLGFALRISTKLESALIELGKFVIV